MSGKTTLNPSWLLFFGAALVLLCSTPVAAQEPEAETAAPAELLETTHPESAPEADEPPAGEAETAPDPAAPDPAAPDPAAPDPTAPDPTAPDPTAPDPTAPDPAAEEGGSESTPGMPEGDVLATPVDGVPAEEVSATPVDDSAAAEGDVAPAEEGVDTSATVTDEAAVIEEVSTERKAIFPIVGGVEMGTAFSQVVSKLGTSFTATIEVGYLLPLLEQRIQAYVDLAYQRPLHRASVDDPRLVLADEFDFKIREEELTLTLGGIYRFFPPTTQLNFYGQLGWRMRFQRAHVQGRSGWAAFGKTEETATKGLGLVFGGGAEYQILYGAIAVELSFAFADLHHTVTGNTTAGGLALQVGYHFFF